MNDYTEIVVLLDRSGSMQEARADHEGGLNSFVRDQKNLGGDVRFTLIQFDSQNACEVVYDGLPIEQVGSCTLLPRGGTPLLDALGRGVAHVAARLDPLSRRPDQTIVMVITDGEENSSHEFTKDRIKKLVEEREKKNGWKFLFLGANIDAFAEGGGLGMGAATTANFANNRHGTQSMYGSLSSNVRSARMAASAGAGAASYDSLTFTPEQREDALGQTAGPEPEKEPAWTSTSSSSSSTPPKSKGRKKGPQP